MPSVDWLQPFRSIDRATVMQVDLSPHTEHEQSALTWLNAAEMSRWQGYLHLGAQRGFSLCRAALRSILCEYLACQNEDLTFAAGLHGKPYVKVGGVEATVNFSVCHSGEYGLLAFSAAGKLGIDVETYAMRRNINQLSKSPKIFAAHEREALAQVDGDNKVRLFTRLWTSKEAIAKAVGIGVGIGLASLAVPPALLCGATSSFIYQSAVTCESAIKLRVDNIGNADFAAAIAQEIT